MSAKSKELCIGILVAILLGLIVNVLTLVLPVWLVGIIALLTAAGLVYLILSDRIADWRAARARLSTLKAIEEIEEYIKRIGDLRADTNKLIAYTARNIGILIIATFIVTIISIFTINYGSSFRIPMLLYILVLYLGFSSVYLRSFSKLYRFEDFKKDAEARIAKLSPRDLVIHSATYGIPGKEIDVAEYLRANITANGKLSCTAGNQMGGDPAPGSPKILRVDYSLSGKKYTKAVNEGEILSIP